MVLLASFLPSENLSEKKGIPPDVFLFSRFYGNDQNIAE